MKMNLGYIRCLLVVSALLVGFPNTHRAGMLIRQASGATPSDIQGMVSLFQTDLGGVNNGGGGGPFATGFRDINWDGVPDSSASPNSLATNFFNSSSMRGVVFSTPGSGFQVSADQDNPSLTPVRFGNIDPMYSSNFQTFSAERLFTPINSRVITISFFVPAMPAIPAYVSGFGAVFSDVELEDRTFIEYVDENTNTLAKVHVPASTNGGLSFLGVYFTAEERVANVRITCGSAQVWPRITENATNDVVVMDDFIYAEPQFAAFDPNADSYILSTAVQADAKILIGGAFTTVGGVTRNRIARLNVYGTLEPGFNPNANSDVYNLSVQADGKVVIGGAFTTVAGVTRNRIARLNADGTLDPVFNPSANSTVLNMPVMADGKIVIGGVFTTVSGVTRNRIARLNTDGTLDTGFDPNANDIVVSTAVQPDGKIVIGGAFTTVGGVTRNRIARLNTDGTLETGFDPNANIDVSTTSVQADGKIVIGGAFTTMSGVTRNRIARLNADGTLDAGFDPNANNDVYTALMQADGKIVIGGAFTTVGGVTRNRIARLNADGTLDAGFDPNANDFVFSPAVQADGKIVIGGAFTTVGGVTRNRIARLTNVAATLSLTVPSASRVQWLRGGASPETHQVTFELSINGGSTWSPLGVGTRISGGWELTGLSLPASGHIRARARITSGVYSGSSGLVETQTAFNRAPEIAVEQPLNTNLADGGSQSFGTVIVGANTSLTFTIKNTGSADLTGLEIIMDGTDTAMFTVTATPTAPVSSPNGSTTFTLQFAPTSTGAKTAALHLVNNDSDENPFDFTLTGTGVPVPTYTVTVATNGYGSVSVTPLQARYTQGEVLQMAATPARWHAFSHWNDGVTINPRSITVESNAIFVAHFIPTTPLETLEFGGVSRLAPVGMPAVFVDGVFVIETNVSARGSATLALLSTFSNAALLFTLDGSEPDFSSMYYDSSFVVKKSLRLRAVAYNADFTQAVQSDPLELVILPMLTAFTEGGGSVAINPPAGAYFSNRLAAVTAMPAPGWKFLYWLDDAAGTNSTASVIMSRDKCVQAVFGTGLSNSVVGSGSVLRSAMSEWYPYGTRVRLTAVPQTENYFALWGNAASGTNNPLNFRITNANPTVTAVFAELGGSGTFALTVVPNGLGQVTATPRANRYGNGTDVTLTALPEAGQDFLNWDGDASGTDNPLLVSMNQSRVITAHFTKRPRLDLTSCSDGPSDEGYRFTVLGDLGAVYRIDGSINLTLWTTLVTLTNLYGVEQFTDSMATNIPYRFYRAERLP